MNRLNLKVSVDCGTMEYKDMVIVGNIRTDGRWIRLPKQVYEYVKYLIFSSDMLQEIESFESEEKKFYKDTIQKLFDIKVLVDKEEETELESVSLELTTNCNLRCKHCCVSAGSMPVMNLEKEKCFAVVDWAEKNKIKDLTFTGGEPLMHPEFSEILRYAHTKYSGTIGMITNLTLLTERLAEEILCTVDNISISLDGYDEKSIDFIRGKGVFKNIQNKIKLL